MRRALVQRLSSTFSLSLGPRLAALPRGVIHSDANEHNLVVTDAPTPAEAASAVTDAGGSAATVAEGDTSTSSSNENCVVAGVIDFGDLCLGPRVYELAVAIAYAILGEECPLTTAAEVAAGYLSSFPMPENEWRMALPMAYMRLNVSVSISTHASRISPENEYILVSAAPAWAALEHLERELGGLEKAEEAFVQKVKEFLPA